MPILIFVSFPVYHLFINILQAKRSVVSGRVGGCILALFWGFRIMEPLGVAVQPLRSNANEGVFLLFILEHPETTAILWLVFVLHPSLRSLLCGYTILAPNVGYCR